MFSAFTRGAVPSWLAAPLALLCFLATLPAAAHVHWTRVNDADPHTLGVYHFDGATVTPGSVIRVPDALPYTRSLTVAALPASPWTGFSGSTDINDSIFGQYALRTSGTQRADSIQTLSSGGAGDATIEFWLKWDDAPTSNEVQIGFRSAVKLRVKRDTMNPANDYFGISTVHGGLKKTQEFTDWAAVGLEEAPLNEWMHFAVCIHSTGVTYNSVAGHDQFNPGSVARFYLNGHIWGTSATTLDISGMDIHDNTKLTVYNVSGTALIDEVAIWDRDLSENGAEHHPFSNGRGSYPAAAASSAWSLCE